MPALTLAIKTVPIAVTVGACLSLVALPGEARADDILNGNTQNSGTDQRADAGGDGTVSVTVGKYNAKDEKKGFNKDKTGKGYWWGSYVNESFPPGWDKCDTDYFWVDQGDPPPADKENAVTPEVLAELAYAEIRVPGTRVTLAPAEATKVNLPMWAWLDGAEFKPVSVTASVKEIGISATATAEPPYEKGRADDTPSCGVKYLRSSGDGTFPLRATVTWEIHWTGTGGAGGDLPDGTFGAAQDVVVQEIQAVNR
ncbi:hypothetical protein [Streptomyces violaceorubidus]|uniref:hypothetical protein n=1 Tax=Streptomyces violaceorubidus TaxID=284042 RepID=UPI000AA58E8A|nr:hypothetical protein [Streptomyces violaceorubidus]